MAAERRFGVKRVTKKNGPLTVAATVTGLGGVQFTISGCSVADVCAAIKEAQAGAFRPGEVGSFAGAELPPADVGAVGASRPTDILTAGGGGEVDSGHPAGQ